MKRLGLTLMLGSYIMIGCAGARSTAVNRAGPTIEGITTSTKGFSIDCAPTSVSVSAHITDPSGIAKVLLWYRVGSDRTYVPVEMTAVNGTEFRATVKGPALPPDRYGPWEFYIEANDRVGNQSKTRTDASVQFLPCVSN